MSEWIEWEWDRDLQYPETLNTRVDVKFRDGFVVSGYTVGDLRGQSTASDHWHQTDCGDDIAAYRVVE